MIDANQTAVQSADAWIQEIVTRSTELEVTPLERELIDRLLDGVYRNDAVVHRQTYLAAAFDLLTMAEYYRAVPHLGWLYCPEEEQPLLLYPYTNVCPRCVLQNKFVYHQANKPQSGVIGARTSRLLAAFLQALFQKRGSAVEVRKGVEPVDLVLIDRAVSPTAIMFAEIKAAPLATLPLTAVSQSLTQSVNDMTEPVLHRVSDLTSLYGTTLHLLLPISPDNQIEWRLVPLGEKQNGGDADWSYRALLRLLAEQPDFLPDYFQFWQTALERYEQRSQTDIFWLTNGCGQPSPRPSDWPGRRNALGYESISDVKSSVGMDRTDDLKKGTYQVLKISSEGNPSRQFHYTAGIISNIHAIRHFDEYLRGLKDIVWTRDESGQARLASELPPQTPLFNLFDGVIALTRVQTRDPWLAQIFDF